MPHILRTLSARIGSNSVRRSGEFSRFVEYSTISREGIGAEPRVHQTQIASGLAWRSRRTVPGPAVGRCLRGGLRWVEHVIGWVRPGPSGLASSATDDTGSDNSDRWWEVWLFECLTFCLGVDEHGGANGAVPSRMPRQCAALACLDLQSRLHSPSETPPPRH